jgi:signal transduction histidine kinase/DNA-binding response OmpR family regulator
MGKPSQGRLLIVDDEVELKATLCETLAGAGYETVGFSSGDEALKALKEQDFDLILTDLMMPGMDGIELLGHALSIDPNLVGIIMTGHGTVQTAVDAMKVGAFDYILKPFKLRAIKPVITRALSMRHLRLENVQLRETVAIHELTHALAFTLDLDAILNKVIDAALQQTGGDEASILLPTPEGNEFLIAVMRGGRREELVGQHIPMDRGIAGWVAQHHQPILLHGAVQDSRFSPVNPRPEIVSSISMPMLAGGKLVGVLNVNATSGQRPFTMGKLKALGIMAVAVAYAIENARLFESLTRARIEAEDANRMKDEFLSTVSHELRTPLTSILGWSNLLQRSEQSDPTLAQGLRVILRNAKAQSHIIDDLLDVSRMLTGNLQLDMHPVDLGPIVAEVVDAVCATAEEKDLRLSITLDSQCGPVYGDEKRLRQIIWNLLSNAVKFTPQGGSVEVELTQLESCIQLAVRDSGQGVTPQFLPYIFDRFRQADNSTTRRHGGLGLGLSIVSYLVQMHSGTVKVESEGQDLGTTFTVQFPLVSANAGELTEPVVTNGADEENRRGATEELRPTAQRRLAGLLILVVEDDKDSQEVIAKVLQDAGAEVQTAGSVAEALSRLDTWTPSLIVCDIGLPDEDGYHFIAQLRNRRMNDQNELPVIALTAYTREEDKLRALAAGFTRHIKKPIEPPLLIAAVLAVNEEHILHA